MMPGLDGTGLLLRDFARAMAAHCPTEVLRYPPDLARYDALVPWVCARLPDTPHVLLAESFSGPLAVRVAENAPEGLRGVIFITSFLRSPQPVPSALSVGLKAMPTDSRIALRLLAPFTTGSAGSPEMTEQFAQALREVPTETLAERLREVLEADVRERLAALPMPHACVLAQQDMLVPSRRAEELAAGACRVERLDGPHFLMQTRPEAAAEAVARCMAALEEASRAD
ncbi:alpha/beta fold hydrolase [Oceanicola sp. D3]|uniref:alpha/beta fold hydrolase n=1 Tax=Oceanicola sp. D3 TaxID=2587163 RepID=UPI001AEFA1BA|nr:alpha/beta hydrolase [Oceanicola sp. D3]